MRYGILSGLVLLAAGCTAGDRLAGCGHAAGCASAAEPLIRALKLGDRQQVKDLMSPDLYGRVAHLSSAQLQQVGQQLDNTEFRPYQLILLGPMDTAQTSYVFEKIGERWVLTAVPDAF